MSIPLPNPSLFPKTPSTTPIVEAHTQISIGSDGLKRPFKRRPHLTQNLREDGVLKGIMEELREMENINREHGWYDRNRNGKQRGQKR